MCPTYRGTTASVIERLLAAPHEFEFVQAVSILLAWLAARGVPAEQAWRDCLRFENSLQLGFPASEIEAIAQAPGTPEQACAAPGFTITPAFMGLLGAQGALPAHVTERIAAWQGAHGDAAPRAFLDLLSQRMLGLFFQAWQKNRPAHLPAGAAGGADRLRPLLLALSGGVPGADGERLHRHMGQLDAYFAGMLAQRPCSGAALERMLSDFFGIAIRLEEAVGHWDRLAPGEQCALGINAELGENVLLGARSWRPDLRARLRIGPLDAATFARFLPSGDASAALRAILARFAEPTVGFEVQLVLRAADVRPVRLAARDAGRDEKSDDKSAANNAANNAERSGRLGRDSFLAGASNQADRADMRYLLSPMAALT